MGGKIPLTVPTLSGFVYREKHITLASDIESLVRFNASKMKISTLSITFLSPKSVNFTKVKNVDAENPRISTRSCTK